MERYTKGGAFKERCNGNIPYAEIISFVSQVENLMEEQGFESLEDLKNTVANIEKLMLISSKTTNLEQDNQLYKEALKIACEEMIEDLHFDSEDDRFYTLQENIEYFKTMARKNIRGE